MPRAFDIRDVKAAINDLMAAKLDPRNWDQYETIEGALALVRAELKEQEAELGQA